MKKAKLKFHWANQWSSENRFIYILPTLFIMRGDVLNGVCVSWLWFTVGINKD